MTLFERLGFAGRALLLDGPTGTELHRRGVPTPLPGWSAHALMTHPHVVREIHDDYIRAGADVITTNTFRTNRRGVQAAGLGEMACELTNTAVRIAREAAAAAGRRVLVAGSVAPVEDCYRPDLVPDDDALASEHRELIGWLIDAGVDMIKIETMNTLREARAAVTAARLSSVPVMAGVVCGPAARLLSGEPVRDAAQGLATCGADAIMINCSSVADTSSALQSITGVVHVPFGAYANTGAPDPVEGWDAAHTTSVAEYAAAAREWLALGATIIGGCCGTRPEHIAALRAIMWSNG